MHRSYFNWWPLYSMVCVQEDRTPKPRRPHDVIGHVNNFVYIKHETNIK